MRLRELGLLCDLLIKMLIRSRLMVGLVFLMMIIIGLITSLIMRRIIYDKAYTLESDIHYGRMIDTTL